MSDTDIPLACNLEAMTPEQCERYDTHKARLRGALRKSVELRDGYEFAFADEPDLLASVAGFVEGERRCCPFYAFHIEISPGCDAIRLRITGPPGTPEFIASALNG